MERKPSFKYHIAKISNIHDTLITISRINSIKTLIKIQSHTSANLRTTRRSIFFREPRPPILTRSAREVTSFEKIFQILSIKYFSEKGWNSFNLRPGSASNLFLYFVLAQICSRELKKRTHGTIRKRWVFSVTKSQTMKFFQNRTSTCHRKIIPKNSHSSSFNGERIPHPVVDFGWHWIIAEELLYQWNNVRCNKNELVLRQKNLQIWRRWDIAWLGFDLKQLQLFEHCIDLVVHVKYANGKIIAITVLLVQNLGRLSKRECLISKAVDSATHYLQNV